MNSEDSKRAFDLNHALDYVDGDRQLLAQLLSIFLEDYPRLLDAARASIAKNDHSRLEREAHTLKGRLALFGIHEGREKASELEAMGRSGDLARAPQALAEIETSMAGILPELESLAREQNT